MGASRHKFKGTKTSAVTTYNSLLLAPINMKHAHKVLHGSIG